MLTVDNNDKTRHLDAPHVAVHSAQREVRADWRSAFEDCDVLPAAELAFVEDPVAKENFVIRIGSRSVLSEVGSNLL